MSQIIRSDTTDYAVLKQVGETELYRVYIVVDVADNQEYLLKIAPDVLGNGGLDREAFTLREIEKEIAQVDAKFKQKNNTEDGLGFQRCFPRLVESFLVPEQGNRRVNVIAIYGVKQVTDLVPLEQWRTRERRRIDPKSSAWIMGRMLKIFTLTHPLGVSVGKIDGGNILVNPEAHHVVFFDWSLARHHDGQVSATLAREEISAAATQVVLALGGNPKTGALPASEQLPDNRYADLLGTFVKRKVSSPFTAGQDFYGLLNELWKSEFHPFTTIPI